MHSAQKVADESGSAVWSREGRALPKGAHLDTVEGQATVSPPDDFPSPKTAHPRIASRRGLEAHNSSVDGPVYQLPCAGRFRFQFELCSRLYSSGRRLGRRACPPCSAYRVIGFDGLHLTRSEQFVRQIATFPAPQLFATCGQSPMPSGSLNPRVFLAADEPRGGVWPLHEPPRMTRRRLH